MMSRNFFSMTGICVALVGFAIGSSDAEARHCGRQRARCYQQSGNFGYRNWGNSSYAPNYNDGSVYAQTNTWNGSQAGCCTSQSNGNVMQADSAASAPMSSSVPAAPSEQAPLPSDAAGPAASN